MCIPGPGFPAREQAPVSLFGRTRAAYKELLFMPSPAFIPAPAWRDLVDILFLSFVAYQLYIWFRGTRALRVLIGLVVLGGVYSVAKLWGLFLTTWVFRILGQVLVILLLILFQSEIRQVLEKVSPLRFLKSRKTGPRGALLKTLADTLFGLAREKTGALIVLTRNDDPSEFLHAGHVIMALPEPGLIRSIFNPGAPAHDGALILSEGRITRMGCILPLSEREDLPERYGTRHRAALGLSERTDAVCLVVSEERGEVSSVVGGRITNWESPQRLTRALREWLAVSEVPRPTAMGFFREAVLRNWGPKLGALAIVGVAWMSLAGHQEIKTVVTAPVRYVNVNPGLFLSDGTTRAVSLALSGTRRDIGVLETRKIRVRVTLARLAAGTHRVQLSARNIDLPFGVRVDRVTPRDLTVILAAAEKGRRTIFH